MKDTPVNDFFSRGGRIREDGLMAHDLLLVQVKKPSESKGPWGEGNPGCDDWLSVGLPGVSSCRVQALEASVYGGLFH